MSVSQIMEESNGAPKCIKTEYNFVKIEAQQECDDILTEDVHNVSITIKDENGDTDSPNVDQNSPQVFVKIQEKFDSDYENNLDIEEEFRKTETEDQQAIIRYNETTVYKCIICSAIFEKFPEFRLHRKNHFIQKRTCTICKLILKSISKLEVHMNQHLGLKPYKCLECDKKFVCKNQLKLHMRSHCTDKKYVCEKCQKAFRHLGTLRSHMAVHSEVKHQEVFKCQTCGKTSPSLELHRKHLAKQHGLKTEIKCHLCNKNFLSDRHLQSHLNQHKELKFPCEYCGGIYVSLYRLKRHIKRAHIPNVCEECDDNKVFYDRAEFTKHKKEHAQNKPARCEFCQKDFDKAKNLSEHIRLQHKDDGKAHKCNICDKEFINNALLRNHVKTHDRCFKCRDCDKLFSSRYNLETHSVVHTGAKNHKCQTCGKFYSTRTSLKNHQATHTNVRNFECDQCHKLFKTNRRLYVHKMSHATEEKFQCDICHQKFRVKQYLKFHMIKHSTVKPYECEACNKRFKHKKSWEKHSKYNRKCAAKKLLRIGRPYKCDICAQIYDDKALLLEHVKLSHDFTGSHDFNGETDSHIWVKSEPFHNDMH